MPVHRWGNGPSVVLVHGAVLGGRHAWRAQRPLAERWTLLAPDRPGHGQAVRLRQDFEIEAALVADQLLDEPVHLVGASYGAIIAMLAAVQRPESVRSLTVIEPPASSIARGTASVDEFGAQVRALIEAVDLDPVSALRRFFRIVGVPLSVTEPVPEPLIDGIRQLQGARPPDEAVVPSDVLCAAGFDLLVVSGGHSEAYEIICDKIAHSTRARRAVCAGAGHLVQDTGADFNALLESFLLAAER